MAKRTNKNPVSVIPYGKHEINEDDVKAVAETLRSDFITQGPKVEEFEREVAKVTLPNVVAMNSGSAALKAMLAWIDHDQQRTGCGRNEVITSPLTFAATVNAIIETGLTPIFADVDRATLCIDTRSVAKLISEETAAILYVDYAGYPTMAADFYSDNGDRIPTSVDSAHSFGARQTVGGIRAYSFHPLKTITTGEGGAVASRDLAAIEFCRRYRNHGRAPVSPHVFQPGSNYRMPDINAALGLSQLKKLERFLNDRFDIALMYNKAFGLNDKFRIPIVIKESANHLYVIQLENWRKRDKFREYLLNLGIATQIHYPLAYKHPAFKSYLKLDPPRCRVAEDVSKRIVSLPLYPSMNKQQVERVINAVKKAARYVL